MNTKGKTQAARNRLVKAAQKRKSVKPRILSPLSGRTRPNQDDVEILLNDREGLEAIVTAIMANGRLATLIAHAWLNQHDYVIAPREWLANKLELVRNV